jgi:hypothetical protein
MVEIAAVFTISVTASLGLYVNRLVSKAHNNHALQVIFQMSNKHFFLAVLTSCLSIIFAFEQDIIAAMLACHPWVPSIFALVDFTAPLGLHHLPGLGHALQDSFVRPGLLRQMGVACVLPADIVQPDLP